MGKSITIPLVVEERVGRVHPNGMARYRVFGEIDALTAEIEEIKEYCF